MPETPVAVQLHSLREECAWNLPRTLAAVADMGYEGVEFAGYHGHSAIELRDMLDFAGLRVAGSHVNVIALLGDELQRTVEFNRVLGNRFLIVPWLPEEMRNSKQEWLKTARLMNSIAERLKPEGMRVGYHNHAIEFQPIDGDVPWELFFEASNADVVMQLDTGNAIKAGISPDGILEIMRKFPGRAATIHLKEFSSKNSQALLGGGEMKWRELFALCETVGGTEWYIVEQESCAFPPIECVRRCMENLKKLMRRFPSS